MFVCFTEERAHKTKVARAMGVKMQPGSSSSSETIPQTTTFSGLVETGEFTGKPEKLWPAMSEEN